MTIEVFLLLPCFPFKNKLSLYYKNWKKILNFEYIEGEREREREDLLKLIIRRIISLK